MGDPSHVRTCLSPSPTYNVSFFSLAGIYGMDFYVVLGRKGFRVGRRKLKVGRVGASHKVTQKDAIDWFQQKFEGIVLG